MSVKSVQRPAFTASRAAAAEESSHPLGTRSTLLTRPIRLHSMSSADRWSSLGELVGGWEWRLAQTRRIRAGAGGGESVDIVLYILVGP